MQNKDNMHQHHSQENNQENKRQDSGRSMVEMLGVLAVIGVLTVGGIFGYTYGMNKYQANKITQELNLVDNQMAITLLQDHEEEFDVLLGAPYEKGMLQTSSEYVFNYGCGWEINLEENPLCQPEQVTYFERLDNVPYKICQMMASRTQYLPYLVEQDINGDIDLIGSRCREGNENTLELLFDASLKNDEYDAFLSTIPVSTAPIPCLDNSNCGPNQYCYRKGISHAEAEAALSAEEALTQGICKDVYRDIIKSGDIVFSKTPVSWYTAQRMCQALGVPMLNESSYRAFDVYPGVFYGNVPRYLWGYSLSPGLAQIVDVMKPLPMIRYYKAHDSGE